MNGLCTLLSSVPAEAASARPITDCRVRLPGGSWTVSLRTLALLVSIGAHVLGCVLLLAAHTPAPTAPPAPPAASPAPLVEVRFVEAAGLSGEGGSPASVSVADATAQPSRRVSSSEQAGLPRQTPPTPVAIAAKPAPEAAPQNVTHAISATSTSASSPTTGSAAAEAGGAGGAVAGGRGSGPGEGGGGRGAGAGHGEGAGTGQSGVAVDRMPVPMERVKPVYPMAARRRGLDGRVVLRIFVDAGGGVREVRVQSAEPVGVFEDRAVEAVRRWRFTPAMAHGAPVGMWMTLPVRFSLDGR